MALIPPRPSIASPCRERTHVRTGTMGNAILQSPVICSARRPTPSWRARRTGSSAGQRALTLADGEGRNGVWLAEQGLDVLSIDFSPKALAKARALAAERGVTLAHRAGGSRHLGLAGRGIRRRRRDLHPVRRAGAAGEILRRHEAGAQGRRMAADAGLSARAAQVSYRRARPGGEPLHPGDPGGGLRRHGRPRDQRARQRHPRRQPGTTACRR